MLRRELREPDTFGALRGRRREFCRVWSRPLLFFVGPACRECRLCAPRARGYRGARFSALDRMNASRCRCGSDRPGGRRVEVIGLLLFGPVRRPLQSPRWRFWPDWFACRGDFRLKRRDLSFRRRGRDCGSVRGGRRRSVARSRSWAQEFRSALPNTLDPMLGRSMGDDRPGKGVVVEGRRADVSGVDCRIRRGSRVVRCELLQHGVRPTRHLESNRSKNSPPETEVG